MHADDTDGQSGPSSGRWGQREVDLAIAPNKLGKPSDRSNMIPFPLFLHRHRDRRREGVDPCFVGIASFLGDSSSSFDHDLDLGHRNRRSS